MPRPRADGRKPAAVNKRTLTKAVIEKSKPADCPYLIWDKKQRGLALSVRPTGSKHYKCIYPFGGRVRWYHLADATAIGLDDARKLAQGLMYQVAQGVDVQAQRKAQRGEGTFDELADRYLEEHAKKKNKSWEQADRLVRKHLRPKWGKLRAADIGRSEVRAVMRKMESQAVANQVLAATSAIFTWAIKEEAAGVGTNPCKGVTRNAMVARDRVLSTAELPRFWKAFGEAGLSEGTALKVILLTGQRPGEVCHMRAEHIADGWWTLPGALDKKSGWPGTKNGQAHRVFLPEPVMELLADLIDDEGFVFPGERGGAVNRVDAAMRNMCKALGVPRATPHDLRRTHGSTVTALGFGREAMNRVQNHREGGIADVYDRHNYAEENKRVMEAVAARILSLADGRPMAENVTVLAAR